MRRGRVVLFLLLIGVVAGLTAVLLRYGLWPAPAVARVQPVPKGDQEIAWIHAATSGATWERFVAGVHRAERDCPHLHVEDQNAFLDQTAAVPEMCLWVDGCPSKLWVRWYKLTSDTGIEKWVEELARRDPPPLAIIGGGSSDRARDLAKALAQKTQAWHGQAPLFLITTATADKVNLDDEAESYLALGQVDPARWHDLMSVYPGRTFRFCFTNSQMAEAVVDFLWSQPHLQPHGPPRPEGFAGALGALAGNDPWGSAALLLAGAYQPPAAYAVQWLDDPYSIDLSEQFTRILRQPDQNWGPVEIFPVPYSVGGFQDANPQEELTAQTMIGVIRLSPGQRPLLVVPAVVQPARRLLIRMTREAPREARNLVAVTGDSISFNNVYRDGDLIWNVQDIPVPLVFFRHQNPVDWPEQPDAKSLNHANSTDDVLLNADMMRIIVEAAYEKQPRSSSANPAGRLVSRAEELAARLQARDPPFFSKDPADGNRLGGSGEFIVCLLPDIQEGQVLPRATLEVWTRRRLDAGSGWRRVRSLAVEYGLARSR